MKNNLALIVAMCGLNMVQAPLYATESLCRCEVSSNSSFVSSPNSSFVSSPNSSNASIASFRSGSSSSLHSASSPLAREDTGSSSGSDTLEESEESFFSQSITQLQSSFGYGMDMLSEYLKPSFHHLTQVLMGYWNTYTTAGFKQAISDIQYDIGNFHHYYEVNNGDISGSELDKIWNHADSPKNVHTLVQSYLSRNGHIQDQALTRCNTNPYLNPYYNPQNEWSSQTTSYDLPANWHKAETVIDLHQFLHKSIPSTPSTSNAATHYQCSDRTGESSDDDLQSERTLTPVSSQEYLDHNGERKQIYPEYSSDLKNGHLFKYQGKIYEVTGPGQSIQVIEESIMQYPHTTAPVQTLDSSVTHEQLKGYMIDIYKRGNEKSLNQDIQRKISQISNRINSRNHL